MDAMEELNTEDKGVLSRVKCWFLSHTQHLNFFTILVLASVSMDFMLYFQDDLFSVKWFMHSLILIFY